MTQSGGLNTGMRNDLYQVRTRRWRGDGLLEPATISGMVKALDASIAANRGDVGDAGVADGLMQQP